MKPLYTILILVLLFAVLVAAGLFSLLSNMPAKDNFNGQGIYVVTLQFKDGTNETYNPGFGSTASMVIPFSNSSAHSNNDIVSANFTFSAKVQTSKQITSWSLNGDQQICLYEKTESATPKNSSTVPMAASGSSWNDNETKVFSSVSIPWSNIDEVTNKYGAGEWLLQVFLPYNVNITFSDGTIKDISNATTSGQLYFAYDGSNYTFRN